MTRSSEVARNEKLLVLLQGKLGSFLLESRLDLGDAVAVIAPSSVPDFFRILKMDSELAFNFLSDITAVDWLDQREERFEVVYHLVSLSTLYRLRVKVRLPEEKAVIGSVTALWSGANFMEREVWDMYGISFTGHPDLRRVLMYDEFVGHPLRKDYPVQGKQPRIQLRAPEVRNTALDMKRDALVSINPRNRSQGQSAPGDGGRFVAAKW